MPKQHPKTNTNQKKKSKPILTRDLTSIGVGKHPIARHTYDKRGKERDF